MDLKNKYIVGMAAVSIFFTTPHTYAAPDDVIVFGGEYEDNNSTPSNSESDSNSSNDSNEIFKNHVSDTNNPNNTSDNSNGSGNESTATNENENINISINIHNEENENDNKNNESSNDNINNNNNSSNSNSIKDNSNSSNDNNNSSNENDSSTDLNESNDNPNNIPISVGDLIKNIPTDNLHVNDNEFHNDDNTNTNKINNDENADINGLNNSENVDVNSIKDNGDVNETPNTIENAPNINDNSILEKNDNSNGSIETDNISKEVGNSDYTDDNEDYNLGEIINFSDIDNDNTNKNEMPSNIGNSGNSVSINDDFLNNNGHDDNANSDLGLGDDYITIDPFEKNEQKNVNTNDSSKGTVEEDKSKEKATKKKRKKKVRFVKILDDDTYDYYLDRNTVQWVKLPYSTTEYMADVWIRMIEKPQDKDKNLNEELSEELTEDYVKETEEELAEAIAEAKSKGVAYDELDLKVLRTPKYLLEHYYLRPKTRQIQFLSALEVVGRPQNAISERNYDYKNWENLTPGSTEFYIYYGVLDNIGTSKASQRGHMTLADMFDEYARIALN